MSKINESLPIDNDVALEQLLSHASVRPVPDSPDEAAVRDAVHTEWLKVSAGRRSRRHVRNFAIAASVLLVVFSAFGLFRMPAVDIVPVASIQKSFGTIYLLGERSVLQRTENLATVHTGQTIVTGEGAGMALAWSNGGSVRLDQNTKVEFQDDKSIFLHSGQIYFDSQPAELIAGRDRSDVEAFTVVTDQGSVMHRGTQFMAHVETDALTVSVREGKVSVDGRFFEQVASRGEQVVFSGSQRPTVLDINEYGGQWNWIAKTSPPIDVDGKSVLVLLEWVCRELGLELEFVGDTVEQAVRAKLLIGRVDAKPDAALRMYMATTAFEWRIEQGVMYVSDE